MIDRRRLRPTAPPRQVRRPTPSPKPSGPSPTRLIAGAAFLAAAFWLGRWSAPAAPADESGAPGQSGPSAAGTATAASTGFAGRGPRGLIASAAGASATSSVALCPCPRRFKSSGPKLTVKRKMKPPIETPPGTARDPTEGTASYLRAHAADLAACAPASEGELRVHLEVTVSPKGAIDRVQVTNLDPLPGGVAGCVEQKIAGLVPPGFDASKPETFALTVVL